MIFLLGIVAIFIWFTYLLCEATDYDTGAKGWHTELSHKPICKER